MTLSRLARRLTSAVYALIYKPEPLIRISISRDRLLQNVRTYREAYPNLLLAPMLKSNAYGHGLCVIGELLDTEDIAFMCVDSHYEARKLREGGVRSPIVVMGFVRPEHIARTHLSKVSFAITDIEQVRTLARIAKRRTALHIKIDTGMHRNGIMEEDIDECIQILQTNKRLVVEGVCSHLADADNKDTEFSLSQLGVWERALSKMYAAFPALSYTHISATKGARFSEHAPMNTVRVGMGLFGYDTSPESQLALLPVLSMQTSITSLRTLPQGESVGYGATFRTKRTSTLATIPVGYAEGLDRAFSNVGSVSVSGVQCPLAGRISMNMASVDVTECTGVARADAVTVISNNAKDPNSIQSMAEKANTTPYVLFAHLPAHIARCVE